MAAYSMVIDFANSLGFEGDDRIQIDVLYRDTRSRLETIAQRLMEFGDASPSPDSRQSRFASFIGRQVVAMDAMIGAVALMGFADESTQPDIMAIIERGQAVVESSEAVIAASRRSDHDGIVAVARMKQAGLGGFDIDPNELVVELARLREGRDPVA